MAKAQDQINKERMGEDDTCSDESCRIEAAANAAMDEGARKVKEEEAYHSFVKSERNKEAKATAEKEELEYMRQERESKAQELKLRMESEKGERLKARVKGNLKSGIRAVGESVVGKAREAAVKAVTPQKDGYLPQNRGGFNFPEMGQPVSFSPKMRQKKGKKNQRVSARIVTNKRPFTTGIGMRTGGPIGTGMTFTPPAVPRFGSPATPKGNFSMPFPQTNIKFQQMNVKPPRFGDSHFGQKVPKREFTRDMRLGVDFDTSPFGKKKTNPLKGKKGGLW